MTDTTSTTVSLFDSVFKTITEAVTAQVIAQIVPQLSAIVKHELAHAQLQQVMLRREDIEGIIEDKLDNLTGFTGAQDDEIENIVERLTTDLTDGQKSDVIDILREEKETNIARAIRDDSSVQSALRQFFHDTVSVTVRCD